MKKVLIAADEVDKWSQLCEGVQTEWECTTVNLDAFEKFHTIAVYDAVLMLVRTDNGKLGRLIWEVRQYSRAPIIVVIPGIHAVKKYIEWGADLVFPHPSVSLINTYLYALLRRSDIAWNTGRKREKQEMIQKGKLLIDWRYHTVYWGERELTTLNEREKAFLYLLADSSRQVVTHEIIFEKLWKEPYGDDSTNMIWCFVRRLRKKLEKIEPEAAKIIQSIRKVGYYLDIGIH